MNNKYYHLQWEINDIKLMNETDFYAFYFTFLFESKQGNTLIYSLQGGAYKESGDLIKVFNLTTLPNPLVPLPNKLQGIFMLDVPTLKKFGIDGSEVCYLHPKKSDAPGPADKNYVSYFIDDEEEKLLSFSMNPSPPYKSGSTSP